MSNNKMFENSIDRIVWMLTVLLFLSFSINNTNVNGAYILMGIIGMIFLLDAFQYGGRIFASIGSYHVLILMFAAFTFLSALWAISVSDAIEKGTTILEILICMSVLYFHYYILNNRFEQLLKAVMWGGYLLAIYTIINTGFSNLIATIISGGRLDSSFDNVNTIGAISAITIVISVYFCLYKKITISNILIMVSFFGNDCMW